MAPKTAHDWALKMVPTMAAMMAAMMASMLVSTMEPTKAESLAVMTADGLAVC